MSQKFHIGDVITVYTGYGIGRGGDQSHFIHGVYEVLNYMTGDDLQTVALPRCAEEARPYLLRQFPWLEAIEPEAKTLCENVPQSIKNNKDHEAWKVYIAPFLAKMAKEHGEYLDVLPMYEGDHESLDPLDDIKRIQGDNFDPDHVIEIELPNDDEPPISPTGDINWKVE